MTERTEGRRRKEGRRAHHLIDLLEREHGLSDDTPALVGVGIVAEVLGGHHESGDEAEEGERNKGPIGSNADGDRQFCFSLLQAPSRPLRWEKKESVYSQSMSRRAFSLRVSSLQPREEEKSGSGDGGRQLSSVQAVGDEVCQRRSNRGGQGRRRKVGA